MKKISPLRFFHTGSKALIFLLRKINFAQMENHPQVSTSAEGKSPNEKCQEVSRSFCSRWSCTCVAYPRDEKKYMETQGSPRERARESITDVRVFMRGRWKCGEIHQSARPHTFALFMHGGDLARVLAKCREYNRQKAETALLCVRPNAFQKEPVFKPRVH